MPTPQSFQNHVRRDPLFMAILLSLFTNLVLCCYMLYRDWPVQWRLHLWWVFMAVIFILWVTKTRTYPLRDQDRIIRLEERLRVASLAPAIDFLALSTPQLVALRFASDAELPSLAARALAENLDPKQIKQSIVTWRPDYERV